MSSARLSSTGLPRRDFLRKLGAGAATAIGAGYGLSVWEWADPAAAASSARAGSLGSAANGRTLVVVEMGGGNDGLNMVVPHAQGAYRDLRPTLAVTDPIDLDGEIGLHPALAKLAKRFEHGNVAIVEGLGYDDPDLSHFGSFAIWWSAKGGAGGAGWLGAYLDQTVGFDDPLAAITIGPGPSPALRGSQSFATTIADNTGLQPRLPAWADDADALLDAWSGFAPAKLDNRYLVGQVQRAVGLTVQARTELAKALQDGESSGASSSASSGAGANRADAARRGQYNDTVLADSLTLAAQLVRSSATPRIIYVNGIGDFDTHQGEADRHPALMAQLDAGIDGLFTELGDAADQVALMTVSEFGRRPGENGGGTDHGTANAHFVIGPKVKGGRYGAPPSLTDLDETANLRHTTDFRRLYATALDWLGAESQPVLGDDFKPLNVFH